MNFLCCTIMKIHFLKFFHFFGYKIHWNKFLFCFSFSSCFHGYDNHYVWKSFSYCSPLLVVRGLCNKTLFYILDLGLIKRIYKKYRKTIVEVGKSLLVSFWGWDFLGKFLNAVFRWKFIFLVEVLLKPVYPH